MLREEIIDFVTICEPSFDAYNIFLDYVRDLIQQKNLEDVVKLLKVLKRFSQSSQLWIPFVEKLHREANEIVQKKYGGTLALRPE